MTVSDAEAGAPSISAWVGGGRRPGAVGDVARIIDAEVHRFVDLAHTQARNVLHRSRPALDRVAAALLERESLLAHEIDSLAGPPPPLEAATAKTRAS